MHVFRKFIKKNHLNRLLYFNCRHSRSIEIWGGSFEPICRNFFISYYYYYETVDSFINFQLKWISVQTVTVLFYIKIIKWFMIPSSFRFVIFKRFWLFRFICIHTVNSNEKLWAQRTKRLFIQTKFREISRTKLWWKIFFILPSLFRRWALFFKCSFLGPEIKYESNDSKVFS